TGIFLPGPFTSPYWNATAVSTAFWFLVVGVFLLVSAPPQNGVEPAGEPSTGARGSTHSVFQSKSRPSFLGRLEAHFVLRRRPPALSTKSGSRLDDGQTGSCAGPEVGFRE